MIEFELPDDHPLVINLNKMLEWVVSSDIPSQITGMPNGDLSEDHLNKRMSGEIKVGQCLKAKFNCQYDFTEIEKYSVGVYEEKTGNTEYELVSVSKTYYPKDGGYIGWHVDSGGDRLYSAWADGESFFRYRDPRTGKIITSYDKPKQWSFRIFSFDAQNPMWHCVYAKDFRVSSGYRFVLK